MNTCGQQRRAELGELTSIQALLVALDQYNRGDNVLSDKQLKGVEIPQQIETVPLHGYIYYYHLDPNNHLNYLFFMHPGSLDLLKDNYNIILIDSTYKTNRYGIPLCHLTGRTSSSRLFDIAYAFVAKEREENYTLIIANFATIFRIHFPDQKPALFITDKEWALKNALHRSELFGTIPQVICQWYVKMCVLTHASAH